MATSTYTQQTAVLNATGTRQFYAAMIGAGGAGGKPSGAAGGGGGAGVTLLTVPQGTSQMTLYAGGAGRYAHTNPATIGLGGTYGGGNGGTGGGIYGASAGGGGFVGITTSTSTNPVWANIIACVGSGGGGGNKTNGARGGNGGGIHQPGTISPDLTSGNESGSGGTLTAGGARAVNTRSYASNNHEAGSQITGGKGSDCSYDPGAGGGAGYYGGGGGRPGGGYDSGPGGGGSGYSTGTVSYEIDGSDVSSRVTALQTQIRTISGASSFTIPQSNYGIGGTHSGGFGSCGWICVWNAPEE